MLAEMRFEGAASTRTRRLLSDCIGFLARLYRLARLASSRRAMSGLHPAPCQRSHDWMLQRQS